MAALSYWEKSRIHQFLQAIGSYVKSVSAGTGASVDNTDPQNPIVSARISTDPSNAITLGTDDGLYAVTGGSVTSVGMSVPSFLSVSGSPVTTSGTLAVTYSGTALPIANGGSGQTTANAALNAFLPAQATHSGKVLQTDGTNTSWQTNGSGTVTSVAVSVNNGISVSGSPITTSGTFTLGLGAITPTSVSTGDLTASGTVSLPAQSITRANLVNGAGLSVIGRPAASSGPVSDIVSTGARTFLASSSANTAVTFRTIDTADLPGGNWVGANNGTDYAAASTALAVDSTWYDTGASVSLTAGTYLVTSFAQGFMRTSASTAAVTTRLYNVTDAAAVTDSECCVLWDVNATRQAQTGTRVIIITVASTKTIRMEAQRLAGGTYTVSPEIRNDTVGRSGVTYVRIA